jgi:hypothetical protein
VVDVTNRFHRVWIFRVGLRFSSEAGDLRANRAINRLATDDTAGWSGEGGQKVNSPAQTQHLRP